MFYAWGVASGKCLIMVYAYEQSKSEKANKFEGKNFIWREKLHLKAKTSFYAFEAQLILCLMVNNSHVSWKKNIPVLEGK